MSANLTEDQITHMVDRFLAWRLPEDFQPDAGVSFKREFNEEYMASLGKPPMRHQPTGTNLFDARQAREMILHMVEGMEPLRSPDPVGELVEALHWYADKANYDADGRCVVYDRNVDRTLPDRGCRARSALAKHTADARVDDFLSEVRAELIRARTKFPGDRIMTLALAEEFGEMCKAVLDEPAANVRKEAVQTAAMAARVVLDGDGSVNEWRATRGLDPLVALPASGGEHG